MASLEMTLYGQFWVTPEGLNEEAPDHTTISRTRRLIDVEAHQQVFAWVLERVG